MAITANIIVIGGGSTLANAQKWVKPIQDAFAFFGIANPSQKVVAAFLSNVGVESGGLTRLVEGLNYSAQGLADTWRKRYAVDPDAKPRTPNALALRLARQPVNIANDTYANRMGNGSVESGDGWNYRGRGLLQITGRANYIAAGLALKLDLENNPDQLSEPEAAARSAVWYFVKNGCVPLAEKGLISSVVKIINGQLPCEANEGTKRLQRYNAACQYTG